jgi:hypothetical protein
VGACGGQVAALADQGEQGFINEVIDNLRRLYPGRFTDFDVSHMKIWARDHVGILSSF